MNNIKFISFASGSSGNCYYIGTDEYGILIDLGISLRNLRNKLKESNIEISRIFGIFVTHDHYDHICSVVYTSEVYHIPVYTSPKTHLGIKNNVKIRKKISPINAKNLGDGESITIRDFKITAFNLPHDASDNQGYTVEFDNKKFTFATDFGEATETLCQHIKDSDFLLIESNHDEEMLKNGKYPQLLKERVASKTGHLSNRKAACLLKMFASDKLKKVFLCHLSKDNNTEQLAYDTSREVLNEDIELHVLPRLNSLYIDLN